MAKRTSPIPKFMEYAGLMRGPADLSSRRGLSRGVEAKLVDDKAEVEPLKKPPRRQKQ